VGTETEWTSCRYGSADEALHDPGGVALYNESVYFNFVCETPDPRRLGPRQPIGGIMRIGLRPTDGYAELSLNLPLPDGSALFLYEREPLAAQEFAVGTGRWRCAGMELAATVPTRRWQLRYAGDRPRHVRDPSLLGTAPGDALRAAARTPVRIELRFDGRFPLHALSASGDIAEGGGAAFARNHYEQFGAVTGSITVGDDVSEVRGGAFRDHSWGPRDWQAVPDSDFTTVLDGDGSAIVCFAARLAGGERPNGLRWTDAGPEPVDAFEMRTVYAGEVQLQEPLSIVVGAGDRELRYDARVRAFLPLRHRSGEQTVRIGQVLLDLDGPAGPAAGWADLTRPAR
jgi:hypothetical protein